MLSRVLAGTAGVAATFVTAGVAATFVMAGVMAGVAGADPPPDPGPPPGPNINGFMPVSPVDFTVADGVYAFSGPEGVVCVMSKATRTYGCSGPLPGAPEGANVVTGGAFGEPGFSVADRPLYLFDKPVNAIKPNTRISMGTVSCGADGGGALMCVNSFDQTGFVIGPAGTSTFGAVNPLLDRPKGTNPYFN